MNVLFGGRPLEEALKFFDSIDIHDLEIGAGGNPGKAHCNPEVSLSDKAAYDKFVETFKKYNIDHQRAGVPRQPRTPQQRDRRDVS